MTRLRGVGFPDPGKVVFDLQTSGGNGQHSIAFSEPVTNSAKLRAQVSRQLNKACMAKPKHPKTSIEVELASSGTLRTYVTSVKSSTRLTPNMTELTLAGGLEALLVLGGDEFTSFMPPPDPSYKQIPAGFVKPNFAAMTPKGRPMAACYTSRRRRPESGEVDVWVALHQHAAGVSEWSEQARPGDPLAIWGPRTSFSPPADTTDYFLICHESGLAATTSIIEGLSSDVLVYAIAETVDEHHHVALTYRPGVSVDWLHRCSAPPGANGLLHDAVAQCSMSGGRPYVYGAGESGELTQIRRRLRQECSLDQEQVTVVVYWRRAAGGDATDDQE